MVRRRPAVASARATSPKRRANARLAVGPSLTIRRDGTAAAAAGPEAALATGAAVVRRPATVPARRAAGPEARARTRLAVGSALAVGRDAAAAAAACAEAGLTPGTTMACCAAAVAARRATVSKARANARLSIPHPALSVGRAAPASTPSAWKRAALRDGEPHHGSSHLSTRFLGPWGGQDGRSRALTPRNVLMVPAGLEETRCCYHMLDKVY